MSCRRCSLKSSVAGLGLRLPRSVARPPETKLSEPQTLPVEVCSSLLIKPGADARHVDLLSDQV